jgi:biotin transporter BioY
MRKFFDQMSVEQGLIIVIIISALLTPLWSRLRTVRRSLLAAAGFPFLVATGFYWLPYLTRINDMELRAWAMLFIGIWFVPSAIVSVVLTFILRKFAKRKKS